MGPNTAMHLSRPRKVIFFGERSLRPGDGKRSAVQGRAVRGAWVWAQHGWFG